MIFYYTKSNHKDMNILPLGDKDPITNGLAIFWSGFAAIYIVGITFIPVPTSNTRVVDTVLGFLLGTIIASILGYFFGSSKSSNDKSETIAAIAKVATTTNP